MIKYDVKIMMVKILEYY